MSTDAPAPERAAMQEQEQEQGGAIARRDDVHGLEQRPVIDQINRRQLELLRSKSPNLTHAELAQALELAWAYKLDPYANEVWFVKSEPRSGKPGRLLIMVGRDGLRRIAQRNGLEVAGDLVREGDQFAVEYVTAAHDARPGEWEANGGSPFHRVTHRRQGVGLQRGKIVGAWARVHERRTGVERGYFDAGLEEYDQSGRDAYGPWNRQKSAMMLGAVERQAIRQATPLGGLVAQGEDRVIAENDRAGDLTAPDPLASLPAAVRETIERARRLGHAGLADVATAEMALRGQPGEEVARWLDEARAELDAMEPPEAEVVPDAPEAVEEVDAVAEPAEEVQGAQEGQNAPEAPSGTHPVPADEAVDALRDQVAALLDEADAVEDADPERAEALRGEAGSLMGELNALTDPDQPTLGD